MKKSTEARLPPVVKRLVFTVAEDRRKLGLTQEELFGLFQLKCPSGPINLAA